MEQESDRERLLRYLRTVSNGLLLGIGCVCTYVFGYGVTHAAFRHLAFATQPLILVTIAGSLTLALRLAKRDRHGPFLGLAMSSLNTAFMALALMLILHPERVEHLSSLPIFQQGLVATTLFCIPLGMALIVLDVIRLSRQENHSDAKSENTQ